MQPDTRIKVSRVFVLCALGVAFLTASCSPVATPSPKAKTPARPGIRPPTSLQLASLAAEAYDEWATANIPGSGPAPRPSGTPTAGPLVTVYKLDRLDPLASKVASCVDPDPAMYECAVGVNGKYVTTMGLRFTKGMWKFEGGVPGREEDYNSARKLMDASLGTSRYRTLLVSAEPWLLLGESVHGERGVYLGDDRTLGWPKGTDLSRIPTDGKAFTTQELMRFLTYRPPGESPEATATSREPPREY